MADASPLIERARALLTPVRPSEPLEKTFWGSPAGKKRIADRLAKLLPSHRTYVEPFAGSAAVLFAKEPSEVEVINDADPDIAEAYRLIQKLREQDFARLEKMSWVGDEATYRRLYDAKPGSDVEKLHRFLYLTHFSYGKMRGRSFSANVQGIEARTMDRLRKNAPRIAKVKVYSGDYQKVIRQYDGSGTVMFLDPPYPGYDVNVGESKFDEERFFADLKALKSKWLMTYGIRGKLPGLLKTTKWTIKRIRTPRTIRAMTGAGGPSVLTQLLVANFDFVEKSADADGWLEDWDSASAPDVFRVERSLLKTSEDAEERFVLGIVLEPEVVDAQGDIYSADEVRQAAHRFMAEYGGLGLQHQLRVNDQVKILESYIAPSDLKLGETDVRKGTWLMAVRVLSDELWQRVRAGELTGFSIGGSARRSPEGPPPPPSASEEEVPS